MPITEWPESERPREKLLRNGASALSDAELLAIFLRTGTAGQSAVDLARLLINKYGSLRILFKAEQKEFCSIHGLGNAKYAQLQAVLELARRHLFEKINHEQPLTSPDDTKAYLSARIGNYSYEVFCCLFLDTRHRTISCEELFCGTIDGASVHPREVVRRVLHHNAAAVIFAHNHPSGVSEPSQADRRITDRLREALSLIDVRVLDHFVIGHNETTSFAERGWL